MKRSAKIAIVVGLLLALLAIIWWLYVPGPQKVPSPQLSFVGFTNNSAGKRMAVLSIRNASHTPVLFGLFVELPAKNGNYERWADGAPERPPTALAAGGTMALETEAPDLGSFGG